MKCMILSGAASLFLGGTVFADTPSAGRDCHETSFSLDLTDLAGAEVFASICAAGPARDGMPVQVLLHGGAYDHRYWDWPHLPGRYSYVEAAVARGYVTVNLDRLGYGASTRPDGRSLTFERGAVAVGQVIDAIRAGELGFAPGPIILNGHSMGGIVAEHVAGQDDGIAALIVSGLANTPDNDEDDDDQPGGPPAGKGPPFIPAAADPRFAGEPWADGYLTTAPGVRAGLFHAPGTIDPEVALQEEDLRHTLAMAELAAVMSGKSDRPGFDGPALYVLGRFDAIACQGQDCRARFEGTDWHVIIGGAGHSLNLSLAAPEFFATTFDWLETQGLAP